MGLPGVNQTIEDPGLGIIAPNAGKRQVKVGLCQKGVPGTLYSGSTKGTAQGLIGSGPMLDSVAQVLSVAKGTVLMMPLLPSSYGTVTSSFALTGSGAGTVTGSKGPEQIVKVKIGTGGALATMTFQVAVGSGAYGPLVTSGADPYTYQVPGQMFTKLAFATGTYVANDIYTLNLDGTVSRTGSGTATLLDGSTNSPVDAYDIWVLVTTSGALGAGAFRYSLDGGSVYSGDIALPSGGKYVIPGTGVVLTFSGTFTLDDLYKGVATAPGASNSDVTTGLQALHADAAEWGFFHVVLTPANAAASASLAAVVATQLDAMAAADRYVFGITECPQTEGDSAIKTAHASFVNARVGICVTDIFLTSPLTGRSTKRNLAWAYTARLSATKLSTHPGQIAPDDSSGALPNVTDIDRDESMTEALDEARFVTVRTFRGQPGFFITRGRMMAAPGSDYAQVMARRVMDRAETISFAAHLLYVNKRLFIDEDTGFILEASAQDIEAIISMKLEAALIGEEEASAVNYTVARDDNLLSTSTMNSEVDVVPFGYSENINVKLGYKNPALRAAAA